MCYRALHPFFHFTSCKLMVNEQNDGQFFAMYAHARRWMHEKHSQINASIHTDAGSRHKNVHMHTCTHSPPPPPYPAQSPDCICLGAGASTQRARESKAHGLAGSCAQHTWGCCVRWVCRLTMARRLPGSKRDISHRRKTSGGWETHTHVKKKKSDGWMQSEESAWPDGSKLQMCVCACNTCHLEHG